MKKNLFLSMIISLIIVSCTQQEVKSPAEGVWKIIGWERMKGDTLISKLGSEYTGSEMEIYSANSFVWVGRYQKDTTFSDNYGGGTYKIDGNRLEQKITFSVDPSMIGTTIRLLWEVKNDTATQTWPLDENWQLNKSWYGIQKWVRVE